MNAPSLVSHLPFGRRRALEFDAAAVISRQQSARATTRIDYRSSELDGDFRFAFSAIETESLKIVANASTAMEFTCHEAPRGIVLVPFSGGSSATQHGRTVEWAHGRNAVYLPPGTTSGASSQRVAMGIDVDAARLNAIACAMLGKEITGEPVLDFNTFRALDLDFGALNLLDAFKQYAAMINAMNLDAMSVERSGIADSIARLLVLALAPHLFLEDKKITAASEPSRIAWLCDYIEHNLTEKITLTDLERLTGLSARTVQYAFRKETGRSPMQWITDRRLDRVRRQLLAAEPGTTLSSIAAHYFTNLGDFARYYKTRFGERPSDTLGRRKA